jgi:hypothetical protein
MTRGDIMFAADGNYQKAFKDAIAASVKERLEKACST